MGIVVTRKSDGYKEQGLPTSESTPEHDYEPPQNEQLISELFVVKQSKEYTPGLGEGIHSKRVTSFDSLDEAMNTLGEDAFGNSSISRVDEQSTITPTENSTHSSPQNEHYRPIRCEIATQTNTWKVEHSQAYVNNQTFSNIDGPATLTPTVESKPGTPGNEHCHPIRSGMATPHPAASSLISTSSLRTPPPISPRRRLDDAAATNSSRFRRKPSLDQEMDEEDDGFVEPFSRSLSRETSSKATRIPRTEMAGRYIEHSECRDDVEPPSSAISLPKRGVLSTFSRRIFSRLVRSHSLRGRSPPSTIHSSVYSKMDDLPSQNKLKQSVLPQHNEENWTISTASNQSKVDSLYYSPKTSLNETNALITVNEEVQIQIDVWKRAAVNGKPLLRIAAILLSLSVIVTAISSMIFVVNIWTMSRVICFVYTILSALLIPILELRCRDENVASCMKKTIRILLGLRRLIVRHFNLFKLVWGRGCLYVFAGSISMALDVLWALIPGSLLVLLGCLSMAMGSYALQRIDTLRRSFRDEAYLEDKFREEDSDRNGKINEEEFGSLVWTIGLEFTEYQIATIFQSIDTKRKGYISYQQFKSWWFRDLSSGGGPPPQNGAEPWQSFSKTRQSQKSVAQLRA